MEVGPKIEEINHKAHPKSVPSSYSQFGSLERLTLFDTSKVKEPPIRDPSPVISTKDLEQDFETLSSVPLFSRISRRKMPELRSMMEACSFSPGQVITDEDKNDFKFHVITKGTVEFLTSDKNGGEVLIGEASVGGFFGELSLLLRESCQIRIRAKDEVRTLALDRDEFTDFVSRHSVAALDIMGAMATRLTQIEKLLKQTVSRNTNDIADDQLTFGQRVADKFASVMGSWTFIIGQSVAIVGWIGLNVAAAVYHWDPYPFIFLNLALSCQAAFAAPVIMMSQNRHAERDRIAAANDHQVNIKTELEVALMMKRLTDIEQGLKELQGKKL